MTELPHALDMYCCEGGLTSGLQNAGFRVSGVDMYFQKKYRGDHFYMYDALEFLETYAEWIRDEFVFINASPPCQAYSKAQRIQDRDHPRLIAPTRVLLDKIGLPYMIENVEDARHELESPILLCGAMFGMTTYRHRWFEVKGWEATAPADPPHAWKLTKMGRAREPGEFAHYVGNFHGVGEARVDMRMPWASRDGIREAVPPQYAEFLGRQFLAQWQ